MKWERQISSFRYDGKPVEREKYCCSTPLGDFRVFQAVNGKWFIEYFYIGLDENYKPKLNRGKLSCGTKDNGIKILEDKWTELFTKMEKV